VLEEDAEKRFGSHVGGLVVSALVDVARELHSGNEADIRSARLDLLRILTTDMRGREQLELQRRRVELEEAARKPRQPVLQAYLEARSKALAAQNGGSAAPADDVAACAAPSEPREGSVERAPDAPESIVVREEGSL
jgi:hypothetical protein